MLKISEIESANHAVTFRLEGRIAGPWVVEMRKACEKILNDGLQLKLDLAEVSYADQTGVAALAGFRSRGVLLAECSPFLAQQLKAGSSK
jgi:ABC-type transporter Mla MlaB component